LFQGAIISSEPSPNMHASSRSPVAGYRSGDMAGDRPAGPVLSMLPPAAAAGRAIASVSIVRQNGIVCIRKNM
jgi:hypothetical protein